jgi:hypothetical protein
MAGLDSGGTVCRRSLPCFRARHLRNESSAMYRVFQELAAGITIFCW